MKNVTVCIITRNRTERVKAILAGITQNTVHPAEVLVIHMNEPVVDYGRMPFLLHKIRFDNETPLPLAAARNYAAKEAQNTGLIFLDADCIPAVNLIENYATALDDGLLLTGNVRYLDADFDHSASLQESSVPHPGRQLRPGLADHRLFWSLNFACTKSTFRRIGGFDEAFTGYGAEDTDFAFAAREKHIPLVYADADVYHQYHPTYRPPLNHVKSIVKNAVLFNRKWHQWPMEDWLKEFEQRGYIRIKTGDIEWLQSPDAAEIEAAINHNKWGY